MSDFGPTISLSQQVQASDDENSSSPDHQSPITVPTLTSTHASSSRAQNRATIISSVDRQALLHRPTAEMTSQRKPRGRPPGSKNKPKPAVIITRESETSMKPMILEISAGYCVVESLLSYARRHRIGLSVVSVSGSVSNVTLRHPLSNSPALSLHGPFHLLALNGTFVGSSLNGCAGNKPSFTFGVSLAGAQGHVFGGLVVGKLMAATAVVVMASTYANPGYQKLPFDADDNGGGGGEPRRRIVTDVAGGSAAANNNNESGPSTGMSMTVYGGVANPTPINCQMSTPDVMNPWGPTNRSPFQ